jgi:hypothetical protein
MGAPIIVLGMHRSGTSLIAGMLHGIGISMGDSFLDADSYNPKGYFEDTEFLWINKGILENSGGIWYDPPTVEEMAKGGKKFWNTIDKTINRKREKSGRNSWGWKDPRTCLTCWTFLPYVEDAKFIVIVRRLVDIKTSLNKTHGHLANWDTVIDAYYESMDRFFQICPNNLLTVSFEELIYKEYSEKTVHDILQFVGKPERFHRKALRAIQHR